MHCRTTLPNNQMILQRPGLTRWLFTLPLLHPGIIIFDMTALFPDTRPEIEAMLVRLLRDAPAWRKMEMVDQLNQSVKLLALSGLRQRYPNDSEDHLRRRLADLLLGAELAQKAYGPLSEDI